METAKIDPAAGAGGVRAGNRVLLRKLLVVALLMFGFGWAMIPLYRTICEITGVNLINGRETGAAARARNTVVDTARAIEVEFDTNAQGPWRFKPAVNHLSIHPGELTTVEYELVNVLDRTVVGQAIPSYAPMQASAFFNKLECFCFQQQTLAAGESRRFPVVFFIDPKLPRDVAQITLSYTFFEVPAAAPNVQTKAPPVIVPTAAPARAAHS